MRGKISFYLYGTEREANFFSKTTKTAGARCGIGWAASVRECLPVIGHFNSFFLILLPFLGNLIYLLFSFSKESGVVQLLVIGWVDLRCPFLQGGLTGNGCKTMFP